MKKLMLAGAVLGIFTLTQAFTDQATRDRAQRTIQQFVKDIEGKTVTIPKALIEAGIDLKIKKINWMIREIGKKEAQATNKKPFADLQKDYRQVLVDLEAAKKAIPAAGFKKTFENTGDWLRWAAEKKRHVANMKREIARQLRSKAGQEIAEHKERWAEVLEKAAGATDQREGAMKPMRDRMMMRDMMENEEVE